MNFIIADKFIRDKRNSRHKAKSPSNIVAVATYLSLASRLGLIFGSLAALRVRCAKTASFLKFLFHALTKSI